MTGIECENAYLGRKVRVLLDNSTGIIVPRRLPNYWSSYFPYDQFQPDDVVVQDDVDGKRYFVRPWEIEIIDDRVLPLPD